MTRCNLLNISKVKQIVLRSQIWFYGSSVSQLVQSSYPRYKARHKGNQWVTIGEFRLGSVSSMHKVAKSDKMALSGSKLGFVSDLELIPLGQFSHYVVPPV